MATEAGSTSYRPSSLLINRCLNHSYSHPHMTVNVSKRPFSGQKKGLRGQIPKVFESQVRCFCAHLTQNAKRDVYFHPCHTALP